MKKNISIVIVVACLMLSSGCNPNVFAMDNAKVRRVVIELMALYVEAQDVIRASTGSYGDAFKEPVPVLLSAAILDRLEFIQSRGYSCSPEVEVHVYKYSCTPSFSVDRRLSYMVAEDKMLRVEAGRQATRSSGVLMLNQGEAKVLRNPHIPSSRGH